MEMVLNHHILMKCLLCGHVGIEQEFWFEDEDGRGEECPKCNYMGVIQVEE